jgi:hypothetical protein
VHHVGFTILIYYDAGQQNINKYLTTYFGAACIRYFPIFGTLNALQSSPPPCGRVTLTDHSFSLLGPELTQFTYNDILSKMLAKIFDPVTDEVKNTNPAVLFAFLKQYFLLIKRRKVRRLESARAT